MIVSYESQEFELEEGETVLEGLERGGASLPSFCRSGSCQTCVMRAVSGSVPAQSQVGLKPAWKQRGLFLACCCRPSEPLVVEKTDVARSFDTKVESVEAMNDRVLRVWLRRPEQFTFEAGQFVQLLRPADGLMRPYSLASLPGEEMLELHVAKMPGGQMSSWLETAQGQPIQVRGPFGECVYLAGEPAKSLVLAGTGTGLAPLLGVIRAALAANHQGEIHLMLGAREVEHFYLVDELRALSEASSNFRVTLSVLNPSAFDGGSIVIAQCRLEELLLARPDRLSTQTTYLCGNAEMVRGLKKKLFLAGASLHSILSDAFVPMAGPR